MPSSHRTSSQKHLRKILRYLDTSIPSQDGPFTWLLHSGQGQGPDAFCILVPHKMKPPPSVGAADASGGSHSPTWYPAEPEADSVAGGGGDGLLTVPQIDGLTTDLLQILHHPCHPVTPGGLSLTPFWPAFP